MPWNPTTVRRADMAFATATDTVRVTTDAGRGYLKALGNHGGPHLLAADFLGTQIAAWLGLPTFEFALINVTPEDEIVFSHGARAAVGPAFITREESGMTWGGVAVLDTLVNPEDVGKLVLFDTWTRNCDRHPPDLAMRKPNLGNVFLSNERIEDGRWRLIAMDHTHCFNCGRDLNAQLAHIDIVQDEGIYGLFPPFKPIIMAHRLCVAEALARLATFNAEWIRNVVNQIPAAWEVDSAGKEALVTLLTHRAHFMTENFDRLLDAQLE